LRTPSTKILSEAKKMLHASQNLDYQKVLAHDGSEVEKLRHTLMGLNIHWDNSLPADTVNLQKADEPRLKKPLERVSRGPETQAAARPGKVERQAKIVHALLGEGFIGRSDNVYSSFVKNRSLSFKQVPHRNGLPGYDIVVAPDFAPIPGLHGIFISADEVMSITLAIVEGEAAGHWQIAKQKSYHSEKQMVDCVTLMSAGFEVPE
jgi:hypothetical protein